MFRGRFEVTVALVSMLTQAFGDPVSRSSLAEINQTTHVDNTLLREEYGLCNVCLEAAEVANIYITSNRTFDDIKPYAVNLCTKVLTARGYHGDVVCPGIVESYGPGTWFIFDQILLDPLTICTKLKYCLPDVGGVRAVWGGTDRPHPGPRLSSSTTGSPLHGQPDVLRILQLSDVHVDQHYAVGAATHCGVFLCCRRNFNGTGSAGYYGDYNKCDLPVHTLDLILSAIRQLDPPPDFVVFTGDSPPHDVWQESWASQLREDEFVVQKLKQGLGGLTIYPAIGNHESFPESFYYQPTPAYQALNVKLADWWSTLFNVSTDERETIEKSAYYTSTVRPGLRVLSFNTDYGYDSNFYTLLNDRNQAYREQLVFMKTALQRAREENEKVIIIGHVPPGDSGSSTLEYGDFYTSLVTNFSDVIALQLFGHTHHDSFELILTGNHSALGPVFVAPSVTTYGKVNPGFRVYQLDSATFRLLDYHQYYLNLTAANEHGETGVKVLYSAKSEYGLADMSAESWRDLTDRMKTDSKLLDLYRRNYLTGSDQQGSCDQACHKKTLCKMRSASLRTYLQCMQ